MVKDLSNIPTSGLIFIDTTILIFTLKPVNSRSDRYTEQNAYISAIANLLRDGKEFVTTWVNVAEVLNVVERKMRQEYEAISKASGSLPSDYKEKDFRKMPTQRDRVKAELQRVLGEIRAYYKIIDASDIKCTVTDFIDTYKTHLYDPNDFLAAKAIFDSGITEILTDDSDFFSDIRFTVYTFRPPTCP